MYNKRQTERAYRFAAFSFSPLSLLSQQALSRLLCSLLNLPRTTTTSHATRKTPPTSNWTTSASPTDSSRTRTRQHPQLNALWPRLSPFHSVELGRRALKARLGRGETPSCSRATAAICREAAQQNHSVQMKQQKILGSGSKPLTHKCGKQTTYMDVPGVTCSVLTCRATISTATTHTMDHTMNTTVFTRMRSRQRRAAHYIHLSTMLRVTSC